MARDDDTCAPITLASASSFLKPSLLPTPRPPETRIRASVISILSLAESSSLTTLTLNASRWKGKVSVTTLPVRFSSFAKRFITPGRTVAICGRCSVHIMVAMRLPPNAGRVIKRSPASEISNFVQSAVRPVTIRAERRGPRSRPIVVAPMSTTSGLYFAIRCAIACA